jgi:hypothetical protein
MRQAVFRPYKVGSTDILQSWVGTGFLEKSPLHELRNRNSAGLGPTPASTIEALLGDCIDHVLSEVLGIKAEEAIYGYMERNYAVARKDIPTNMGKFFTLTEEAFGNGSKTIARCIVKRMWQQMGWAFTDMPGLDFWDYLEIARARMAKEAVGMTKVSLTANESLPSQQTVKQPE